MKKVSDFFTSLALTAKSFAKAAILSRPVGKPAKCAKTSDFAVILANGPSLKQTIEEYGEQLKKLPTVAVNFMANTKEFSELRPDYYVLADPHFFIGTEHENVKNLWENLAKVSWTMTLCVPRKMLSKAKELIGGNRSVALSPFNFVGAEGFQWAEALLYDLRLAMPRPRNVLIPAIMTAISAGYKQIHLFGADHSWLETIRVDDENHVISVQPHFYADSKKELKRSESEYRGYHLHDILHSFYIAFRSYHTLQRYAIRRGINIYNATPGSFIDAFPRKSTLAGES